MDGEIKPTSLYNHNLLVDQATAKHKKPDLRWIRLVLLLGALIVLPVLIACTSSSFAPTQTIIPAAINSPFPSATSAPTATATATLSPIMIAAGRATGTALAASLDPCALLPDDEASTLAKSNFWIGEEGILSSDAKTCTYGSQTTNVFFVELAQPNNTSVAQGYRNQFLADFKADVQQFSNQEVSVTQVPGFADGAVFATVSVNIQGITVSGSAIGFLTDGTFFGFSDIVTGGSAPSIATLQTEAGKVLKRLPVN